MTVIEIINAHLETDGLDAQFYEIIRGYLVDHEYDSLYNCETDCACELTDLAPCSEMATDCEPGYKFPCDCGDHDYHIGTPEMRDRAMKGVDDDELT